MRADDHADLGERSVGCDWRGQFQELAASRDGLGHYVSGRLCRRNRHSNRRRSRQGGGNGRGRRAGTATAVGASTAAATGFAAGTGTATGVARDTDAAIACASGPGATSGVGALIAAAVGSASGIGSASATSRKAAGGDVAVPWWWHQYVARHAAERQAREADEREAKATIGNGWGVIPPPIGRGVAFHDPDADIVEHLAAIAPFLLAA